MAISSGSEAATSEAPVAELTVRGLILGALMTAVFTAANVFFGLKAGLTFDTSIPATVISMALLRGFKSASIQENNIVQTIASAAGTLSSIIFVLPGLVMIGWWTGFPYWQSFAVCALGGMLGVMYSIPLRRALVTESDLPYPEGVACAEVLRVGAATAGGRSGAGGGPRRPPRRGGRFGCFRRLRGARSPRACWPATSSSTSASAAPPRASTSACPWPCSASAIWSGFGWAWRCCWAW